MKAICSSLVAVVCLSTILAPTSGNGQASFEDWLKKDRGEFQAYKVETTRAYEEWHRADQEAYKAFVEKAGAVWGDANVWVPEKKTWVQYTDDLEERTRVDFEAGVAHVEVLIDSPQAVGAADVEQALLDGVHRLAVSGTESPIQMMKRVLEGGTKSLPTKRTLDDIRAFTGYRVSSGDSLWGLARRFFIHRGELAKLNRMNPDQWLKVGQKILVPHMPKTRPTPTVSKSPILADQLKLSTGTQVTAQEASRFAEEVVKTQPQTVRTVTGKDGRKRKSVGVSFKLIPEHLAVRARQFLPLVLPFAEQFGVDPALVMAIMHTESSFNPRARSGAPAFGLMQLVPRSGARDAYRLVEGKDKLVSDSYLYQPKKNIELGVAFLHILQSRYLRKITDPLSRMYCAIAAYNTGAGNVSRAFTKSTSVSRAAPIINSLEPSDVLAKLISDLPYDETRRYIQKVLKRIPLYKDLS